jgi:RNA polymerase sigma factor (TIGR02999 family)
MPPQPRRANSPSSEQAVSALQERRALDDVYSLVYEELRRLAAFIRRNEVNAPLDTTALVHEAWLKLKDSPSVGLKALPHFKAIAARAMRQVLVDEARKRNARKRGGAGEAILVSFADGTETMASGSEELLVLDAALKELASISPRQAQVVESRFFGGLSAAEIAAQLRVSESVIDRDWRAAKAWLAGRIRPHKE